MNVKKQINIKRILKYKKYDSLLYNNQDLISDVSGLIDGVCDADVMMIIDTFFSVSNTILNGTKKNEYKDENNDEGSGIKLLKLGTFCFLSNDNDYDEIKHINFYRIIIDEIRNKIDIVFIYNVILLKSILNNLRKNHKEFFNTKDYYNFLDIFVGPNNWYMHIPTIRTLIFESYVDNGIFLYIPQKLLNKYKLWNINKVILERINSYMSDEYISNLDEYKKLVNINLYKN